MDTPAERSDSFLSAGIAATELIAKPDQWINRRVETIELLSQEETRRRVSVDFTLIPETQDKLTTEEGVVVPISVLTKDRRRNFDLRDEAGAAVPVLGRAHNAELAQTAVVNAALDALPPEGIIYFTNPSPDGLHVVLTSESEV